MMIPWIAALQTVVQTPSSTASTTLRRIAYVPESHVDFIFSVQRERVSIAALAIVVLILLMLMQIVRRRRARRGISSTE
jgi:cell division protein FtsW (lipid II flippase)